MKTPKESEPSRKCTDCDHYEACRMRAGYNFLHEADADRCAIYAEPSLLTMERRQAALIKESLDEDVVRLEVKVAQLESKLAEYEKPLEPMTLEEVKRHVKEPEAEPVWLEDVEEPSNTGWTYSHIIYDWMHGFDERTYGKEWRCWSRRPTDEERKAAKWDD